MSRPTQVTINLAKLKANFELAKRLVGNAQVLAVVKANAYGHGAVAVARALPADAFGVASIDEALALRDAGITAPIVLLGGIFAAREMMQVARHDLQVVVHTADQVQALIDTAVVDVVVWLKLDTGMHRLGFAPEAILESLQRLTDSGKVARIILMSHFANADDPDHSNNARQLQLFERTASLLSADHRPPFAKSMANSAALLTRTASHYEWVRPGLMLYGANPLLGCLPEHLQLLPVMTLRSRVVAIRELLPGEGVGYGGQWIAQRKSLIATVAVGYGDGYPRHAPNGTPVLVNGQRCALVGRVSMDFIGVDVSGLAGVNIGDEVILWGDDVTVDEVAQHAGTLAYELLTGVQPRVSFHYED